MFCFVEVVVTIFPTLVVVDAVAFGDILLAIIFVIKAIFGVIYVNFDNTVIKFINIILADVVLYMASMVMLFLLLSLMLNCC